MALRQTLALLVLLGTALLVSAKCNLAQHECKDGGCILLIHRCNGKRECKDGSDEDPAVCNENVFIVPEAKNMTAIVDYKNDLGFIEFHLCNDVSCGMISLFGDETSGPTKGKFSSMASTECNALGQKCKGHVNRIGDSSFPTGKQEFGVQVYKGRLAIWRWASPRDGTQINVTPGSNRLKIIPGMHVHTMPAQLFDDKNNVIPKVPAV